MVGFDCHHTASKLATQAIEARFEYHMSTGGGTNDNLSEVNSKAGNGDLKDTDQPLYVTYPVNSVVELTLSPDKEIVRGLVYTTDEISNSIVLKKSLKHTTLASEIRICNAASVLSRTIITTESQISNSQNGKEEVNAESNSKTGKVSRTKEGTNDLENKVDLEVPIPLPVVSRKALDEREKRAIRLAEEGFAQINQKASPEGQAVFDRLLKACNEVVWKDESIFVLNQIRVDPPYGKDNCKLLVTGAGGSLNEGSLERVKKIVASSSTISSRN